MRRYLTAMTSALWLTVSLLFISSPVAYASGASYQIPDVNDFRPAQAANEIEAVVNGKSVITLEAEDGKIYIDADTAEAVSEKNEQAQAEMAGYVKKLNARGMYLNRELTNVVTVKVKNADLSDFVEIVMDARCLGQIANVSNLKIVPQYDNEYILLSNESINSIADIYGEFRLQIKRVSDTYTIRFVDRTSDVIGKYATDIKVAVPAKHSRQTVYVFKDNTWENWGGQFNGSAGTLEFMTKYSGQYNAASPEIVINDIDNLTENEQQIIQFMVVRGYFELKNNKFRPGDTLTRYEFVKSLTGMFFALDDDAVCKFTDVDKKNYRYVAAAQSSNIVEGFDDNTFRGNDAVTAEQVIAFAARTINQKNGYVYPEQIDKYLKITPDNTISDWAKKEVALASREGIYQSEMDLTFSEGLDRKNAALILYRLFMIMNNTPEAAEITEFNALSGVYHKTFWNKSSAAIVGMCAAAINLAAIILSSFFIKRRRRENDNG